MWGVWGCVGCRTGQLVSRQHHGGVGGLEGSGPPPATELQTFALTSVPGASFVLRSVRRLVRVMVEGRLPRPLCNASGERKRAQTVPDHHNKPGPDGADRQVLTNQPAENTVLTVRLTG